jgi:hypothetical protein
METQIRGNIEAYIDDVVVKSKTHGDLLDDLKVTFDNLRKYKMMLNHKKCVFCVSLGKLLSYMISALGELMPIQIRWRSSTNCNHLESKEKSRSWQVLWQHSAYLYPSRGSVAYLSTNCYARKMASSGMIRQ